jgi:hypothetical protein
MRQSGAGRKLPSPEVAKLFEVGGALDKQRRETSKVNAALKLTTDA